MPEVRYIYLSIDEEFARQEIVNAFLPKFVTDKFTVVTVGESKVVAEYCAANKISYVVTDNISPILDLISFCVVLNRDLLFNESVAKVFRANKHLIILTVNV